MVKREDKFKKNPKLEPFKQNFCMSTYYTDVSSTVGKLAGNVEIYCKLGPNPKMRIRRMLSEIATKINRVLNMIAEKNLPNVHQISLKEMIWIYNMWPMNEP